MSPALSQTNAKPSLLISALLSCTLSPSPCFAGLLCPRLGNPTWARAASSPVFMLRRGSLSLVLCFPEGPPGPEANVSQDILVVKLPNSLSLPSLTPAQERKYLVILKEKKKKKTERKKKETTVQCSLISCHPGPQGLSSAPCQGKHLSRWRILGTCCSWEGHFPTDGSAHKPAGGGNDVNTGRLERNDTSQLGLNPTLPVINLILNLCLSGSCVYSLKG